MTSAFVTPRQGMFQPQGTACPVEFFRLSPICTAEMEFADGKNIKLDYEWKLGVPMSLASGEKWIGTSVFYIIDQNNHNVNNKTKRQLRGKLRQAIQVFAVERNLMTSKKRKPMSKVDVFETFAGAANISRLAPKFGLKSLSPADYATGFDLELEEDQSRVDKLRRHYRPMFLVQGLRCTEWSLLQDNVNYVDRPQELHERREHSRPMMRKVVSWCRQQHDDGNYFLLENPLTSRLWLEPEVQDLMKLPGVQQSECHGGAYGQVDSKGNLVRKGFRFVGNCPWVLERLCRKLSADELSECKPLEGKETTLSEEYPHDMVLEILRGIKSAARERDPERFNRKTFSTLPVQLETDLNKWTDVFKLIEEHFQRTAHRSRVLSNTDPLWKMIKPLVPWHKVERVQIASQPATLRLPMHVPHTHRGWAILYNDGEIEINSEDLSDVRHPRGRFKKPVNFAIFLFGQAESEIETTPPQPDSSQQPLDSTPPDDPQLQLIPSLEPTGISFAPELRLSPEVKTAISRLHKNLGHPPAAELKKLLAMQGVRDDHLLRAVEGLRCETCLRTKMPDRPPPSTSKAEQGYHQFGDLQQADIFYVRDITGKNFSVLGMICETTHLHAAALVGSRNPAEIADAMFNIWFNPFGLPLTLRVDPDCAFQGEFEQLVGSRGVFIDFIPPEAHNRIGLIERHNAVLRDLCERVIEAQGVTGPDQVKQAVSAGVFSMNACTWSSGRPPFVAALGRIPRVGYDLFSDERALVTGETRDQAQQFANILRVEAQQHLAAMSVDSKVRRALLRKTPHETEKEAPAGSIVAYWRWTSRSGKKRGGYRLARMLGMDPDNKSYWLQSGTNTVKVAKHQLRLAHGFEQWEPDGDDIKTLRIAGDNFRDGILDDQRLPDPTPVEEEDPENPVGWDRYMIDTEATAELPLVPPISAEPTVAAHQVEEGVQTDVQPQPPIQQHITQQQQNITFSPTFNRHSEQHLTFGLPPELHHLRPVRTPSRKPRARSRTPIRDVAPPELPPPPHAIPLPQQPAIQNIVDPTEGNVIAVSDDEDQQPPDATRQPSLPSQPSAPRVVQQPEQHAGPVESQAQQGNSTPTLTPAKRLLSQTDEASEKRQTTTYQTLYSTTTGLLQQSPSTYTLQNYGNSINNINYGVWSRLDFNSNVLHSTHYSGPCKRSIRHRRVREFKTGQILYDQPYDENLDGSSVFANGRDIVTELWFEPPLQQQPDFLHHQKEHLIPDDYHDGSHDVHLPVNHYAYFQAYKNNPEYDGDGESDDSDMSCDDMRVGKPKDQKTGLSRIEQRQSYCFMVFTIINGSDCFNDSILFSH